MNKTFFRTEIYPIFKGVLIAYGLMVILLLCGAAAAYFAEIASKYYHTIGAICLVPSLFFGGFFAARAGYNKGWLKGIFVGIAAALIMMLISEGTTSIGNILSNSAYYIISSAIGGICGIK